MAPVIFCPKVGTEIALLSILLLGPKYLFNSLLEFLSIFYATNFLIGCLLIDIN